MVNWKAAAEKAAKELLDKDGNKRDVEKEKRIKEYRRNASRMAAKANKRIQRLEKSGYTDSPAYQKYVAEGGQKFGVQGKDYNQVQAETARLRRFLDSETSTIRGINKNLKEMAANTGMKYKNLDELRKKSSKFFELSSKVEQYLRTVEDMASAIGYQKIWEAVNQYVQQNSGALEDAEDNVDSMVKSVTDALKEVKGGQQNKPDTSGYKLLK